VREALALRCIGWSGYIRLDFHESLSSLEAAVTRFRQAGMLAQAAECLHMLSLVTGLQGLGELPASQKFAEDAVQLSRLAGDPRQEAISLRRIAIVKYDAMEYEEALRIVYQALNLHRELGDRYEECNALNALGVIHSHMNRHAEALEDFQQAFQMALTLGSSMTIWIIFANLEWHYYRREGLYEEFLTFTDEILNRTDIRKDAFLLTNILQLKAKTLTEMGLYPRAIAILGEALALADQNSGPIVRSDVRLKIANLHAELGQFNQAHDVLEQVHEFARRFERPVDVAAINVTEAEVSRREWEAGNLRQIRQAAAQADQAIALLTNTHWSYELALALTTGVWIALAQNQAEKALEYAQRSGALFDNFAVRPEGWNYALACALWANGQDEEANTSLENAYQRVMKVANSIHSPEIRKSWLEDVYINRQIVNDWVNYHGL
jgi:tetratricopeptide (TPR) repeat protein